jgi:hypothetical protein
MRSDKAKELLQVTLDDLRYILGIGANEDPDPPELRRVSLVLRRLLLPGRGDDLLQRCAKHLNHKIIVPSRNYGTALDCLTQGKITFFQRGGASLWGVNYEGVVNGPAEETKGVDFHSSPVCEIDLGAFRDEVVLGFYAKTISRTDVIEYMANKAGGGHFDVNRQAKHALLDQIREVLMLRRTPTGITIEIHRDRYFKPSDLFTLKRDKIDPASAEILATCCWLAKSPSLGKLRSRLEEELAS